MLKQCENQHDISLFSYLLNSLYTLNIEKKLKWSTMIILLIKEFTRFLQWKNICLTTKWRQLKIIGRKLKQGNHQWDLLIHFYLLNSLYNLDIEKKLKCSTMITLLIKELTHFLQWKNICLTTKWRQLKKIGRNLKQDNHQWDLLIHFYRLNSVYTSDIEKKLKWSTMIILLVKQFTHFLQWKDIFLTTEFKKIRRKVK